MTTERLHFMVESPANFVRLACTILFEKREAMVKAGPDPINPFRKRLRQTLSSISLMSAETWGWALYIVSSSCTSKSK